MDINYNDLFLSFDPYYPTSDNETVGTQSAQPDYIKWEDMVKKFPTFTPDPSTKTSYFDGLYNGASGTSTTTETSTTHTNSSTTNTYSPQSSNLDQAIKKHLGVSYNQRSNPRTDCSGFVASVYKELGLNYTYQPTSQLFWSKYTNHLIDYRDGKNHDSELNQIQKGDLVFLTTTTPRPVDYTKTPRYPDKNTAHVAIVVEVNGTKIKVAESQGNNGAGRSKYTWWELGDNAKYESGYLNYSRKNGRRYKILGFGRLKSEYFNK